VSTGGFVGLALAHSQPGDHICVILSGDFPFILRKTPDGEQYKLIGEAYVHGIMDGEGLEPGKAVELVYLC
jgi:hypothetical protein